MSAMFQTSAPQYDWLNRTMAVGYGYARPGGVAGGGNVNGADLVVTALADGRRAAAAIHTYLQGL